MEVEGGFYNATMCTELSVCSKDCVSRDALGIVKAAGCGDQRPRLSQRANQIMGVSNARYMLLGITGREVVFGRIEIILVLFYVA